MTWSAPPAGSTLSGEATIKWQAADVDPYPTLYALVKYSPDGGASWQPVGNYFAISSGAGQLKVNCAQLPASANAKFKVLVSDGTRTGVALSGKMTVNGYSTTPRIVLSDPGWTAASNSPYLICIPLLVRNTGGALLTVSLDPASIPSWLGHLSNRIERRIPAGGEELFTIQGRLNAAGTYTATLKLKTNDPAKPTINFPLQLTVDKIGHTPSVVLVLSEPALDPVIPERLGRSLRFIAWERANRSGLDARLTLERVSPGGAVLVQAAPMQAGPLPGQYLYDWAVPSAVDGQSFAVEVSLRDPATGAADLNGSVFNGPDLTFSANELNHAPVFTLPAAGVTTLTVFQGATATLRYAVSDPDGDPLGLSIQEMSSSIRWDQAGRTIYFTPGINHGRGDYPLTLTATDEHGAIRVRHWIITVQTAGYTNYERLFPQEQDGAVLDHTPFLLGGTCYNNVKQKGGRFDWRRVGTTAWNKSPLIDYRDYGGGWQWGAIWLWDVSALTPTAEYEVRYVNVNPAGKDDPAPPLLRFRKTGQGGTVQQVTAPTYAIAGQPLCITVRVLNQSSYTWTAASGHPIAAPGGATDPFTKTKTAALPPLAQASPGATAVYTLDCAAPATPGTYKTRWQHFTGGKYYGAIGEASIIVLAQPPVSFDELRAFLLGQWTPTAAWLAQADVNKDAKINIADVQSILALLGRAQ